MFYWGRGSDDASKAKAATTEALKGAAVANGGVKLSEVNWFAEPAVAIEEIDIASCANDSAHVPPPTVANETLTHNKSIK